LTPPIRASAGRRYLPEHHCVIEQLNKIDPGTARASPTHIHGAASSDEGH